LKPPLCWLFGGSAFAVAFTPKGGCPLKQDYYFWVWSADDSQ